MPEPVNPSTEVDPSQPAAPADQPRKPPKSKLKLLVFAIGVVVTECLVAYLFLPSATDAAAVAAAYPEETPSEEATSVSDGEKRKEQAEEEEIEVDLGEFTVSSYQPGSDTSLSIDFHLFGTVLLKDKADFDLAMEANTHRVRDEVIVIVRGAELHDLADAGLGLIKRQILEKTNHLLGRPFLQTVIFSDFSFIEQ